MSDVPEYERLLHEARALLREQEMERLRADTADLCARCLADPGLLYPPASFRPRFVVWELTLRCNMKCRHCGSDAGALRGEELSPQEALAVADQLGALGCERLTLLGGEPFLREDWEAITRRLQAAGVRVNVITNGWLTADLGLMQRIRDAGLTTFAVSVDGWGPGHDALRMRPGSFARILKSYELAAQVGGLRLAAVTTVTKECIGDLDRIYATLVEHGVGLWQIQVCTPQGRMQRDDPVLPDDEDLLRVADFIVARKAEGRLRIDPADNLGYFGPWELEAGYRSSQWGKPKVWSGCQAGCQVAGIDANGDLKGCLSLPSEPRFIEGNLREHSLETLWNRPGAFAYNREFSLDQLGGFCADCTYRGLCRAGCVSHAYCTSGERGANPTCLHRILSGAPR